MKTKISIIFSLNFFIFIQIIAQECISGFVVDMQKQYTILKENEKRAIKQFMKVGFKVHPNYKLQESNVIAKPIYCIFKKKHYPDKINSIKNILCYLDTKRVYINEVNFYKDSLYYCKAFSAYSNFPDQPISGKIEHYIDLSKIILKENPDMVFTFGESNGAYYFLKNSSLYVYSMFHNKEKKFLKYQLDDFITNYLNEYDLIIGTDYSPSIYCK